MGVKVSEAEASVRTLTRHKLDARLTSPDAVVFLNLACRALRFELQTIAPELYAAPSEVITFADDPDGNEIVLSKMNLNFDNIYRVEKLSADGHRWFPVEGGSSVSPNENVHGQVSMTLEHHCLKLSAPGGRTGGSYRVLSHTVPAWVTDPNAYFQLPAQLSNLALIYRTCALVGITDGDGLPMAKAWNDLADIEIKKATPSLENQLGIHPVTAGIRRVMGR